MLVRRPLAGLMIARPASAARPAGHRRRRRARAALLLLPLGMVLVIAIAWAGVEAVRPEAIDPDYHLRRDRLRERIAENPGRPISVVIGSSRTAMAFEPESLPDPAAPIVWFNMSHFGSGPVMNDVILSRLLDDGVRPDVVAFEVMPVLYVSENDMFLARSLTFRDLVRVRRHSPPGELDFCFARERLTLFRRMSRADEPFAGVIGPRPHGGLATPIDDVTEADRVAKFAVQTGAFGVAAKSLNVRPMADRALRHSLTLCRERGITPILFHSPEGPKFRSLYDPSARARFDEYIANVAAERGARVIDARDWLDESDFMDSHHVLRRGALRYTSRLAVAIGSTARE